MTSRGTDIPLRARVLFSVVIPIGLVTLFYSAYRAFSSPDLTWLFLVSIAVVSGLFPVRLPFARSRGESLSVTVSDVFVFAAILLYSPEVAVIISITDGVATIIRADRRKKPYRVFYNLSQLAFSTWAVGHLFYALAGATPPLQFTGDSHAFLFLNLGLCALTHYVLNSGSVALALSLVTGERLRDIFSENLLWASLTNVAGAAAAAIIFLNFESTPVFALAVTVPIILVIYYAYKMNLHRINQAQTHFDELDDLYQSTVTSLAMAIDAKDQSTHGHVHKVRAVVKLLGEYADIRDPHILKALRAAALLHDVGKLAVPEYILNKPSRLTEAERRKVRLHPTVGADILETVPFPYPVARYVRHHHERWDGTGYPDGLAGEAIPLGARILSLADAYVALRSDRPFRPRLNPQLALNIVRQEMERAFDPKLVEILVAHAEEVEAAMEQAEELTHPTLRKLDSVAEASNTKDIQRTVFRDIAWTHREMQAVFEIAQSIGQSLSVTETLEHLATRIKRFVPYSACSIYLVNVEDDRVLPHHVTGMYHDLLEGVEIKLGEGVTGWVAANNEPLKNVVPQPDFPNVKGLSDTFASCLAVPLAIDKKVVGVITLYSDTAGNYTEEHLSLMQAIAPHSATAIKNAIIHEEAREDAYTDPLTGLPNLRYFNTFVDEELKRAERVGYPVSLLMMDLEKFKLVNDRFGHKRGDVVLLEVGNVLHGLLRKSDICLRYGGDEFVAILPGVDKELAIQTRARIQAAFDREAVMSLEKDEIRIGISVGIATFPVDGSDPDLLVAIADREMYRNKLERSEAMRGESVLPFDRWRERR
jgi:diguanylate cyclase (GGDEF)-like protein/putative nucleotidyltransferase with HDIG domain